MANGETLPVTRSGLQLQQSGRVLHYGLLLGTDAMISNTSAMTTGYRRINFDTTIFPVGANKSETSRVPTMLWVKIASDTLSHSGGVYSNQATSPTDGTHGRVTIPTTVGASEGYFGIPIYYDSSAELYLGGWLKSSSTGALQFMIETA